MDARAAPEIDHLRPVLLPSAMCPSQDLGAIPAFEWIEPERLVVDRRYQRAIGKLGRPNILRIYQNFWWSKFMPVVVTPAGDEKYAIIDGQHRATAALMHPGIEKVPCMVVQCTPDQAAAVFAAINGDITSMTKGQIWKARVVAGDPIAVEVNRVLLAADVRIIAYRLQGQPWKVGETMAITTLESMYRKYGAEVLTIALQAITQTSSGNPGCVVAPLIKALCDIVGAISEFQKKPTLLYELMDELDLSDILEETSITARREKKEHFSILKRLLSEYLAAAMQPSASAAA